MHTACTVHTKTYVVIYLSPSAFADTVKPRNWQKPVYELDPEDPDNNGYENEDLIVWMRTAALPTFRKLYRKIDHTGTFKSGLPSGTYKLTVKYGRSAYVIESNI